MWKLLIHVMFISHISINTEYNVFFSFFVPLFVAVIYQTLFDDPKMYYNKAVTVTDYNIYITVKRE